MHMWSRCVACTSAGEDWELERYAMPDSFGGDDWRSDVPLELAGALARAEVRSTAVSPIHMHGQQFTIGLTSSMLHILHRFL